MDLFVLILEQHQQILHRQRHHDRARWVAELSHWIHNTPRCYDVYTEASPNSPGLVVFLELTPCAHVNRFRTDAMLVEWRD